jgi:hypothetical protein
LPVSGDSGQQLTERSLDCVTAPMQQNQRYGTRRPVNFVVHPKAVDGRISGLIGHRGVHRVRSEK